MDNLALKRLTSNIPELADEAIRSRAAGVELWAQLLRLLYAGINIAAAVWYWHRLPNQRLIYLALAALWFSHAVFVESRKRSASISSLTTFIDFSIVNFGLLLTAWKGEMPHLSAGIFLLFFPLLAISAARYRPSLTIICGVYAVLFYIPISLIGIGAPWFRIIILLAMTFICSFVIRRPKAMIADVATETVSNAFQAGVRHNLAEMSTRFHEAIFPPAQLHLPAIWCSSKHTAGSQTGGDYFGVFDTGAGPLVILGDFGGSSDKDLRELSRLHSELVSITARETSIQAILEKLNSYFWQRHKGSRTLSCVVARWEGENLHYVNAGHLPTVQVGKDSQIQLPVTTNAVGKYEQSTFTPITVEFPARDLWVAYTDGLYSKLATTTEQGIEEIASLVDKFRHGEVNTLCHRVFDCAQPGLDETKDDATIVVVRRQPSA